MWGSLSRADDLVALVKSIDSIGKLKSLRNFLANNENTMCLRDSHVYAALQEIPKQMYEICKEDPIKVLTQIADHLF